MTAPELDQINIVSADFARTADFFRGLGVELAKPARTSDGIPFHANCALGHGPSIELDSAGFARSWNAGWQGRGDLAGRMVLGFRLAGRTEVDRLFQAFVDGGHRWLQPPNDAFWGARHAVVEDPNGVAIGLMSPVDDARRRPPPRF